MDRSFGSASVTSVVQQTPSPTLRTKPSSVYPDLSASTYITPAPVSSSALTRNVRFTTAGDSYQQQQLASSSSNPFGPTMNSAPPSRIQSHSQTSVSPKARLPISTSPQQQQQQQQQQLTSPSSKFASTSASKAAAYVSSKLASGSSNQPAHLNLSPVKRAAAVSSTMAPKVAEKLLPDVAKRKPPPIGRGEAARRLRINAVMLVLWWLSSRTYTYKFMAGHLVQMAPAIDTPLHFVETLLALTLFYNILDAMRSLNRLSTLTSPVVSSLTHSSPRLNRSTTKTSTPHVHTPIRSSPKTRPNTTSITASPPTPLFRASVMASPNPPSPKTPSSLSNAASQVLRRSIASPSKNSIVTTGTPVGAQGGSPLSAAVLAASEYGNDGQMDKGSPMSAFKARHSPSAARMTIDSQNAIDRIFD
ncbi:hypothetical protein OIO90_000907 [Microbotryomycetes sp. JL221]|nr:hypothetical protein OIO90_000907 [Microbotryomycetes sp. JL221]